jgi:hypothetical protein
VKRRLALAIGVVLHSTLADTGQDDAPGGDDGDDGDDGEDDEEDDDEEYDEEDDEEEYDDEDDEDEVEGAGPGQTTDHQKVLADFYNVGRFVWSHEVMLLGVGKYGVETQSLLHLGAAHSPHRLQTSPDAQTPSHRAVNLCRSLSKQPVRLFQSTSAERPKPLLTQAG